MMRALWTAASGMITQQTNVDNISNNLSNVNTTGFKKEQAEFKSLLYQNLQTVSTNNAGEQKPVNAQVGLGVRTSAITSIFSQGNLYDSTNPLDMAISGDGFFKVRTNTGEVQYTRSGNIKTSPTNGGIMLCTTEGYPILDVNNNPIVVPNNYTLSSLTVDSEGKLSATNQNGVAVNLNEQIGLVQFSNPAGLEKTSGSLYKATEASGNAMEETTNQGLTRSSIKQYYLEGSNVQVVDEMVNLIVAQRAYEMNSKTIQSADTMLEQANNLKR